VWVSIPKKSKIRKIKRAKAAEPRNFSSNFHTDSQQAARKLWVKLARFARSNRHGPSAMFVENSWMAIRTCGESAAPSNALAIFQDLHSKVTNAVLYLANTDAAFVICESRLLVASCGSGEVEASLAGKAPQSWFGALSLRAFARSSATYPFGPIRERPAFCRRARNSGSYRNSRSGMTSAHRRWGGVGTGSRLKV
jgi:hypothetical protein